MVFALGVLKAVNRNKAVIEFDVHGTILTENQNFCDALGYDLDEIVGEHHRIFVKPEYSTSAEYRAFWQKLGSGHWQHYRRGQGSDRSCRERDRNRNGRNQLDCRASQTAGNQRINRSVTCRRLWTRVLGGGNGNVCIGRTFGHIE